MAAETIRALDTTDPLVLLPAEIVLRVLDYASPASLASLTRLTKAWNAFIDGTHQDAIYSSPSKTIQPACAKNFSFLDSSRDFSKYFKGVQSWKEICRRQTLLTKGWTRERPVTRESTIQVGNDPIWRFRPDFKRRIFLSTSQMGGMNVTDMDSGNLLWRLDANTVRPFAHLEYEDGTAVWDREGNAVEVWRADPDAAKGVFQQVAVLEHDRQTRGFQLSSNTLCVVSSEKKGYVYDLSGEPTLKREIDIEDGAVGHLDQGPGVVAYSLGNKGYHFFNKDTGEPLGVLHPKDCTQTYHIIHPRSPLDSRLGVGNVGRAADAYPPQYPGKDRTTPIEIKQGRHPLRPAVTETPLSDDEWGAGMLNGKLFAGVSRGGRVFVCSDWRKALESTASFTDATCTIECDSDGSTFDLGGWLAIRNHKLMFETQDRAYIVGLNDDDTVRAHDQNPQRPSFAYATSAAAQLAVPVSFMGIYDDCVMTTFTTLRYRQRVEVEIGGLAQPRTRILPTKVIRILSFAPDLENPKADDEIQDPAERGEDERVVLPEVNTMRSDLIQLIAMLEGEPELEDDVQVEMGEDVGEELGLEEWLGEEWEDGEWEDEEEGEQGRSTGRHDLEDVD
ncbi:hypothetical protein WHR41_01867 [Cladosporium halotolerans]|uniref:F-box domain-containing protein n=1 Tax=Cladosporium halotolerans TaxID=1052096 RepID=A0AB34KZ50_9PEZI